ncbi:MAG: hypothetical protein ACKOEX_08245 [Planctomycetia bacterium]
MQAFLHAGSAVVRVPKGMSGFRLDTTSTDVLDLGTEFAVRVMPDRATDVQVYDGAAENGHPARVERHSGPERRFVIDGQQEAGFLNGGQRGLRRLSHRIGPLSRQQGHGATGNDQTEGDTRGEQPRGAEP